MQFVIPGLTKPAPYLIRGNLVIFPPGQAPPRPPAQRASWLGEKGSCHGGRPSWAGGWIPAGVYPVEEQGGNEALLLYDWLSCASEDKNCLRFFHYSIIPTFQSSLSFTYIPTLSIFAWYKCSLYLGLGQIFPKFLIF